MTKAMLAAVGGLSTPSKMPGFAYGIPAKDCRVGSFLRRVKGSTCSKCYALKGTYSFSVVKIAQQRRLDILRSNLQKWTDDMVTVLVFKYRNRTGDDRVFRWHDSGDIQSLEHLRAIVTIARRIPDIRFWLPTRELAMVRKYLVTHPSGFPANLAVRVSAGMIGETAGVATLSSTVNAGVGYACPAYRQGGECRDCRACWNSGVKNVDYPLH